MKINKLFLAAIAATTFLASCSNDQEPNGIDNIAEEGQKAKLTIQLLTEQSTTEVRATGANIGNEDRNIGNYVAIVLDKQNEIIASAASTSSAGISDLVTTTAANRVLVISNLNSSLVIGSELNSDLTNLTKLAREINDVVDLSSGSDPSYTAALNGDAATVWSAGETTFTWDRTSFSGDGYHKNVPVVIRPVPAKINLSVTVDPKYDTAADGNFKMAGANEGIWVLNAVSKTKFFGDKAFESYVDAYYPWLVLTPKAYYSAANMVKADTEYEFGHSNSATRNFLQNGYMYSSSAKEYNYYVFENDADKDEDYPTIVTLKGTWGRDITDAEFTNAGVTDETQKADLREKLKPRDVFFPIHMTSRDAGGNFTSGIESTYGKGVQRGKDYRVILRLSEKVFTGDHKFPGTLTPEDVIDPPVPPGTDDPTIEIVKGYLNVTVTVENWVPMAIEKKW